MSGGKTILLVEDNPDDELLTVRAFDRVGITTRIDVARDGQEALDFLFAEGAHAARGGAPLPAVVLLDLKLPKVDGLEVLRRIRAEPATRHLPVVILTSSREDQDMARGYGLGCNSYVRKPVDFVRFGEAAKQIGIYWTLLNELPPAGPA